jgi:hypothetical protein
MCRMPCLQVGHSRQVVGSMPTHSRVRQAGEPGEFQYKFAWLLTRVRTIDCFLARVRPTYNKAGK